MGRRGNWERVETRVTLVNARLGVEEAKRDMEERAKKGDHPNVLRDIFPEALAFISDPAPLKWILCTRRAAKSYSMALDFIFDSFTHPYCHYLILGVSRLEMKEIYWDNILKKIDLDFNLHATFNESELTMRMPNRAVIRIAGADANEKEKRKFLGGKKRKVGIDEAQSFGTDLRELVYGVLKPAVSDLRGSISVVGTPGNLAAGFFHALTNGCKAGELGPESMREPGWSGHTWKTTANPHMKEQHLEDVAMFVRMYGQAIYEVPWFRQMYLGEWVIDLDALCYKFSRQRNAWDGTLPKHEDGPRARGSWHHVLAIDIGYSPDPCGFAVLAYHDFCDELYVIETWKQWRMDITDITERVKLFEQRYPAGFDAMVIDGANKTAVEEMRRRKGLPLIDADKQGKSDFIELMNAEYILGKIKVDLARCNQGVPDQSPKPDRKTTKESLALADEYAGLIWDPKKLLLNKREEHPACPNHLADACLYGWRHAYQYLSKAPEKPPDPFTPAWFQAEVEKMRAQEEARLEQERPEPEALGDSSTWEWWTR